MFAHAQFPARGTRILRRSAPLVAVALVALLFALAGCGVTNASSGRVASSGSATATVQQGVIKGTTVRPCPGPAGSAGDVGTPALVLGPGKVNGSAHVGDLIQLQLPTTQHWMPGTVSASLETLEPAGIQDDQHGICVWNYRALSAGTASINFTATARCEPPLMCPQYVAETLFTVQIG
ncbi:MAG: hypothetical protein OJF49_001209 [Ktedonobacterales bacterium]|nr:MAG: hypothetical protein OJF49_001209 [Ktedonobacterales bacterium]